MRHRYPTLTVIVHDIDHVRVAVTAAAQAGGRAVLFSAAGAIAWLGGGYWAALERLARSEFPEAEFELVLDCGDRAGDVLAALRAGCGAVRFSGRPDVAARLAAMARAGGAQWVTDPLPAVDLSAAADPEAACRRLLCDDTRDGVATGDVVTD